MHSSIIHSSQMTEAAQMPFGEGGDAPNVAWTHNETLSRRKKNKALRHPTMNLTKTC